MKKLLLLAVVFGVAIFTLGCPANKKGEPPKPSPPTVGTTQGIPPTGVTKPEPPKGGPSNVEPGKTQPSKPK